MTARLKVAIVGAGPAALAAAEVLQNYPLDITIIDEQSRAGGQILRQPPRSFSVDRWLEKRLYARPKRVLRAVEDSASIDWRLSTTVLGITADSPYRGADGRRSGWNLWIQSAHGTTFHQASAVLVATGCYERPLMFPGWTRPGVMGAGAIQAFVKSQQFVPGNRFVLTGSHPLQLVVADQLVSAGAKVASVLFTQSPRQAASVLRHPLTVLRHAAPLAETARILWRLRRAGVPVRFERTVSSANGDEAVRSVQIVRVRADGTIDRSIQEEIECDRLGVCNGFVASTELARQAGADVLWREDQGGWVVRHDEWQEASIPGLFVAGEVTGVAGADAALEKGRIAAAGILHALGHEPRAAAAQLARAPRDRLARIEQFARMLATLARPPQRFADELMSDDTILCRCESISRRAFHSQLQEHPHVVSADAAKLLTRVGMGMCQGRLCGPAAARLIALERQRPVGEIGPLHAQMPVKPLLIDALQP